MGREIIEFECNDCQGFFIVNLNTEINGDFRFVCPECQREHPRTVEGGKLVGREIERLYKDGIGKGVTRNGAEGRGERILIMKSAYSREKRLGKLERGGFLAELWCRTFGSREA